MPVTRSRALAPVLCASSSAAGPAGADWPQWGGPNRDFQLEGTLAPRWPEGGPKIAWQRALDEGYSGIAVGGEVLYTLGRSGESERVIALSERNGETLWTYEYLAPPSQ